jgi:hypothetical protein
MNVFTYVIEHDLGFAPNPFHGVCSLACCKPRIRKAAKEGDYVLGTGAVKPALRGHLTFWMEVDEILTFDEYWADNRFRRKKPVMVGTTFLRYGDNIYHRDGGKNYKQEYSFHSLEDGSVSRGDLHRDTGTTDKVLLGRNFAFLGRSGILIPDQIKGLFKSGAGERYHYTDEEKAALLEWLGALPARGYVDEPAHWQYLGRPKKAVKKKS